MDDLALLSCARGDTQGWLGDAACQLALLARELSKGSRHLEQPALELDNAAYQLVLPG